MRLLERNPNICEGCFENFYLDGELPVDLSYEIMGTKCRIVNLVVDLTYYKNSRGEITEALIFRVYGNKIYDSRGKYGTNSVGFLFVLRNAEGKVIISRTVTIPDLIEGEDVSKCEGYYYFSPCDTKILDKKAKYIVEIVDLI